MSQFSSKSDPSLALASIASLVPFRLVLSCHSQPVRSVSLWSELPSRRRACLLRDSRCTLQHLHSPFPFSWLHGRTLALFPASRHSFPAPAADSATSPRPEGAQLHSLIFERKRIDWELAATAAKSELPLHFHPSQARPLCRQFSPNFLPTNTLKIPVQAVLP